MPPVRLISPLTNELELREVYLSEYGILYQGDCLNFLSVIPDECVDIVFADPPFNLGKDYGKSVNDNKKDEKYLTWSKQWISESIRVLKPGGSLFIFNLPKWCIEYGAYLNQQGMVFRHWISCRMPKAFPRGKKMSPAHYGLLYYTKGEPAVRRLTDLGNGQVEDWESARGKRKVKSKQKESNRSELSEWTQLSLKF